MANVRCTLGATEKRGPTLSVATFNVHAGVDGWGRPFDVVGACRAIDADVLVLQETWTPDDGVGVAESVGRALGYTVFEQMFAGGRVANPHPQADERWMKRFGLAGSDHAIYLDSRRPINGRLGRSDRYLEAGRGRWGVAVLSRLPARGRDVIDLGQLQQDPARRFAVVVEVDVQDVPLTVVGTHMSHVTYGAPVQFRRLHAAVRRLAPSGPRVLAGDMNMWGPPLAALLPGWRRALRRKTWPAWRPHSQVDHILIRGPLAVEDTESFDSMGSDHVPLRARLAVTS